LDIFAKSPDKIWLFVKPITVARADLSDLNWQKKVTKVTSEEEILDFRPFAIDSQTNETLFENRELNLKYT
jgi:hypothetical protein